MSWLEQVRAAELAAGVQTKLVYAWCMASPLSSMNRPRPPSTTSTPGEGEAVLAPGHPGQAAHGWDTCSGSSRAEGGRGHAVTAVEASLQPSRARVARWRRVSAGN